ncbi:BTB/POZ domain-containing protein At5g17580 isoform X1 [Ziziphus jujuba]|uniref:BTB/POZ domain-containing protein At5g17580 isoform X1 n=2 Tax=Ziziphus jujuba TaxID=326968 RepID=A0A6P6FR37_ZIZJJ|nr:BTB/POZ domain-containing protein At5g17580 isoform X1 [Ziziphus jujuba]
MFQLHFPEFGISVQARGLLQLGFLVLQSLYRCLVRLRNSTGILLFQKMQIQRTYKTMTNRESRDISSWLSKSASPSDVQLYAGGVPFTLNKELLAAKSSMLASLLKEKSQEGLLHFLRDIPANPETFELVARFCHGYELQISTENVVPLSCLAHYLGMTESRSRNNLLLKTLTHFKQKILPSWNETIKAFQSTENVLPQAMELGLVDACIESIITKAINNPRLLGDPIKKMFVDDHSEDEGDVHRQNARRLFVLDWKPEDLTTLSLQLYEPVIHEMSQRGVPSEYITASLCNYAKKWVFSSFTEGEKMSICRRKSQKEILEAVERLLPHVQGLLPCTLLFEMLRFAIVLEASSDCRNGFEMRIGKQLDEAKAKDLLIPSLGYAREVQYDIDCVKRIVKHFYESFSAPRISASNIAKSIAVAELIEEFLTEVASDIDLKVETFITLAEMSVAASLGTHRSSDGLYKAIDIYLNKHRHLTESEREEVCQLLDCQKMSIEACEHAGNNERLPLRVVVQVLFVRQLQLRDTIMKEVQGFSDDKAQDDEEEEEVEHGCGEEKMRIQMEKMSKKVMELERKCSIMKREIEGGCRSNVGMGKKKISLWGEMKRKFGCISTMHNYNCQVKKKRVHPKSLV